MNNEWIGKAIQKKNPINIEKNSKKQSEIAACEQKITSEKAIFFKQHFLTLLSRSKTTRFFAPLLDSVLQID